MDTKWCITCGLFWWITFLVILEGLLYLAACSFFWVSLRSTQAKLSGRNDRG
jgi:hypothetical protein